MLKLLFRGMVDGLASCYLLFSRYLVLNKQYKTSPPPNQTSESMCVCAKLSPLCTHTSISHNSNIDGSALRKELHCRYHEGNNNNNNHIQNAYYSDASDVYTLFSLSRSDLKQNLRSSCVVLDLEEVLDHIRHEPICWHVFACVCMCGGWQKRIFMCVWVNMNY